jgi:type I restriction enzyme S subunit
MSFPRYAEYKDSGVEWLGEVPANWEVTRLKFIAHVQTGIAKGKDNVGRETVAVPYLRVANVQDGHLDLSDVATIEIPVADLPRYQLRSGDVLMNEGGDFDKLGRGHIWDGSIEPCIHQNHVFAVRPFGVSPEWLNLFTGAIQAQFYFMSRSKQSTNLASISSTNVMELPLVAPPRSERELISKFLGAETAKIDALVEGQQRLVELLKEKRQAVISQAVTKGLDLNVQMKDSGVEWLGRVPEHWELGGLTRFIGPVVDYRGRTPTKVDDGVFLVTARNIRNGKIDYEASEEYVEPESAESLLERGRPEIGDLLFTMEAPLGQVALIDRTDIALAQRIVKFRGRPGVLHSSFLLYWLMSDPCQARLTTLATGSTALGIKASKLGMIECLVPPVDEQVTICQSLERDLGILEALVEQAEAASSLLAERRIALISAAVTGKIDVRGFVAKPEAITT